MKRKRLDRGAWWSHNGVKHTQYFQKRVDTDDFHGLICLVRILDGGVFCWDLPIAGKTPVVGAGMSWLQLIPDGQRYVITAKYVPREKTIRGKTYPDSVSVWYGDMIDRIEYDDDGVAVMIDQYLDVIFTPQGDRIIDDRDELDAAYAGGELSEYQYHAALDACETVLQTLCADTKQTEIFCSELLLYMKACIRNGEKPWKEQ